MNSLVTRIKRTPESKKIEGVRISHQTENQKENVVYALVPGTYIPGIPFVLALEGGVNSNPSSRERLFEDGIYPLLF